MDPRKDTLPSGKDEDTDLADSRLTRRSLVAAGGGILSLTWFSDLATSDTESTETTDESGFGEMGFGDGGYGGDGSDSGAEPTTATTAESPTETATETATPTSSPESTSTPDSAPRLDRYVVTEAGSPNPHAEITADWVVIDSDSDLQTITVEVFDSASNRLVDSDRRQVSGGYSSGSAVFNLKHSSDRQFDVVLTAVDSANNECRAVATVSE